MYRFSFAYVIVSLEKYATIGFHMATEKDDMTKKGIKSPLALKEEEILAFWKEKGIFKKTLEKPAPKGDFVFYEGPPTANGKPGIHHLEARAFKDAIPRYKTMQGFNVRRKGGWDTHGLPVELQVEKELGLKSKKEIESYGIGAFNQKCKESVWKYVADWQKFTDRIGYFVDLEHPYVTYEPNYIESLWAIVKKVSDQKLLYKDYKVVPWCPRCGTGLSSHELAQGYAEVKDLSVTVKFKLKSGQKIGNFTTDNQTYILAWTTTPWTLPGNVGLAVGEKIVYTRIKIHDSRFTNQILIVAKDRIKEVCGELSYEIIEEIKGKNLVGLEYEPLYPFLKDGISGPEKDKLQNAYKIYPADFVTTTDGTGVVHTAVMYGQEDFELGTKVGLPKYHLVNEDGTFKAEAGFLAGKSVVEETTTVDVIKDLASRELLFKKEKYAHTYPHCWRCKTRLIYFARDSWYIKMSNLRDKLISENQGINWEPAYIKDGRFGEWLREVKDWAISRERYWGTPLPVWSCTTCKKQEVVGSVEDLKKRVKKSGNRYLVMRHGQYPGNTEKFLCSALDCPGLTDTGRAQAELSAKKLADKKIDMIIASPIARTRQTAEVTAKIIGFPQEKIVFDERIKEIEFGVFEGKPVSEYHKDFHPGTGWFAHGPQGGESHLEVKRRMGEALYDFEQKYQNKTILIVTHDTPAWLLASAAQGLNQEQTIALRDGAEFFMQNAEVIDLPFAPLPHNTDFELDLHRPYIDTVELSCDCGGSLTRVKEVMDVWFDSGAMPFAQDHYPFENKKWIEGAGYPADFIAEAIDQTRGWFYTLHAIGALMGKGKAYKNVICLGHILDKEGKKMSKSLGNIVEPWEEMNKFGVDALRFFMYSVNQPGDSKNYDPKTVDEIVKKVFNLLSNVLAFYQLYAGEVEHTSIDPRKSPSVLDSWILAKTDEMVATVTEGFEHFQLFEPSRAIREFTADLSQWYLRRSRDRIKGGDAKDRAFALATTREVLLIVSKLLAPLTPFFAESLYQSLKGEKESVHLETWPVAQLKTKDHQLSTAIIEMTEVRKIVSLGLEARMKAKINVRQPLGKLTIHNKQLATKKELLALIADEVNVKQVVCDEKVVNEVELDTEISAELKEEGMMREFIRAVQDLRKEKGLTVADRPNLVVSTDKAGQTFLTKFKTEIIKVNQLKELTFGEVSDAQNQVSFDTLTFSLEIK
ncbi:MAG: hypothetical protein RLZZ347_388 [Candidatus Parcubacteria bacterium]